MARSRMAVGRSGGIGGPPPPPVYARGGNHLSVGGSGGGEHQAHYHAAQQQMTTTPRNNTNTNRALQVEVQGMSCFYYHQKVDVHDLELSAKPQFFVRVSRFNGKKIELSTTPTEARTNDRLTVAWDNRNNHNNNNNHNNTNSFCYTVTGNDARSSSVKKENELKLEIFAVTGPTRLRKTLLLWQKVIEPRTGVLQNKPQTTENQAVSLSGKAKDVKKGAILRLVWKHVVLDNHGHIQISPPMRRKTAVMAHPAPPLNHNRPSLSSAVAQGGGAGAGDNNNHAQQATLARQRAAEQQHQAQKENEKKRSNTHVVLLDDGDSGSDSSNDEDYLSQHQPRQPKTQEKKKNKRPVTASVPLPASDSEEEEFEQQLQQQRKKKKLAAVPSAPAPLHVRDPPPPTIHRSSSYGTSQKPAAVSALAASHVVSQLHAQLREAERQQEQLQQRQVQQQQRVTDDSASRALQEKIRQIQQKNDQMQATLLYPQQIQHAPPLQLPFAMSVSSTTTTSSNEHGHGQQHRQEQQTKIDLLERDKQILHKVLASQQEQKMDLTKTIDSLKGQLDSYRAQVNNLQQWRDEHEHEYAHNNNPSMVHAQAALQEQNTSLEQQLNALRQQHKHETFEYQVEKVGLESNVKALTDAVRNERESSANLQSQLKDLTQAKQERERVVASIQQDLAGIAHKLSVFDDGSSKENESDKP
jgi:hypothetical protein